jgi:hypothetical protein
VVSNGRVGSAWARSAASSAAARALRRSDFSGVEYLSKLCEGFHVPNDWRERFVSLSDRKKASKVSHSVTIQTQVLVKFRMQVLGIGGQDGDGADSELAECASLEEPCDKVCLPTGTLFRKSVLVSAGGCG